MIQKYFLFFSLIFLLVACGGGDQSIEDTSGNSDIISTTSSVDDESSVDYSAAVVITDTQAMGAGIITQGYNLNAGEWLQPGFTLNQSPLGVGHYTNNTILAEFSGDIDFSQVYYITVKTGEQVGHFDAHPVIPVNAVPNGYFNQLLIVNTNVTNENGQARLILEGYNFDNGDWPPQVTVNDYPLEVDIRVSTPVRLEVLVPEDTENIIADLPDRITLRVQTGSADENYDAHELSGILFEVAFDVLACNRTNLDKVPASGEHCCTTSRQDLCWKTGPIRDDTKPFFGNSDEIPRYHELTRDYEIPVAAYFAEEHPVAFPEFDIDWDGSADTKRQRLSPLLFDLPMYFESNIADLSLRKKWDFLEYTAEGNLIIKKGYRWDGASTGIGVRLMRTFLVNMRSSLIHDAFYDLIRMNALPCATCGWPPFDGGTEDWRDLADTLFYLIAKEDGHKDKDEGLKGLKPFYKILRKYGQIKAILHSEDDASWRFHTLADASVSTNGVDMLIDGEGNKSLTLSCASGSDALLLDASASWPIAYRPQVGEYQANLHETTWEWTMWSEAQPPINLTGRRQNMAGRLLETNLLQAGFTIDDLITRGLRTGVNHFFKLYTDMGKDSDQEKYQEEDVVKLRVDFDTEPPVITGITESLFEWPPNHKYKTFTIEDFVSSVSDDCSELTFDDLVIIDVTSDESDDGKGDGHTLDDIVIADDGKSVDLRIERQGMEDGRVYTVYIQAVDERGNIATEPFEVQVPHDRN